MDYIKNDYKGYIYDGKYTQVFKNKPTTSVDEKTIIKLRNDKQIKDSDMEIVEFLYDYRFADIEMLEVVLSKHKLSKDEILRDVSKLVKHRVLNAFGFVESKAVGSGANVALPMDALTLYCLDIGGRQLISHFNNADTTPWNNTTNMRSTTGVSKDLTTNLFYTHLLTDCDFGEKDKIKNYFHLSPELSVNKIKVKVSFAMQIQTETSTRCYIGDVVRKKDFPTKFREHLANLDSVLVTQAWRKYFYDTDKPPVVFFICEDDEMALEVSKMIVGISSLDAQTGFRVTTNERLQKGLGELGAFAAYDADDHALIDKKIASFK